MTLIGRDVVRIILGPRWDAAGSIFTFFAPGIGILLMYKSVTMIHLSLGTTGRLFRWTILEVAVTAPLFFLGLRWGPTGVAAAWTASFCILILPAFQYAGSPIQLEISAVIRSTWRFVAASLLAGCACALVIRFIGPLADLPGWSGALVRAIVTSVLFGALYVGSIILVHGGYAPLRILAGVMQDMISWKKPPTVTPPVTEDASEREAVPSASLAGSAP